MKQERFKIPITEKELDALLSLADLAESAILDAENEHREYKETTRRNGGYSQDLRIGNKILYKWANKIRN